MIRGEDGGMAPRPTGLESHSATVAGDHIEIHRWIRCSCDWEGDSWHGEHPMAEHQAMAEWAAHVHVAEGLAVPDDERRSEDEGPSVHDMDADRDQAEADREAEQAWREGR